MIKIVTQRFKEFLRDDDGPTAVEYAVMVSMIAMAVIASVGQVATATKNSFNSSGTAVNSALSP
jgi:pilus assembly protein Flp/PilA